MDFGYRAEEILWLVESGVLTLGYQSSSYLTDRVPELGFVDLPFLFADTIRRAARWTARSAQFLAAGSRERVNYRILGWYENGFRQISNRLRTDPHAGRPRRACASACCRATMQARTFELLGAVPLRWT